MKKAISYMACSMAAMLALSSCGSAASSASTVASSSDAASTESTAASEASNEPVTITFAQYSGSGDNEQYLQQMVDNYMKENPNVTIDLQTYGYDDYFTQMTAKVSGGQAPDVFELDYQNFVSYAKKGALMPLDDILTKDGIDTSIYNDMALKAFSAAVIDGASMWRIFFKIILPMSGSAMATLAILAFMDMWNDYLLPLVLLSERSKFTLPLLLSTLSGQYKNQYNLTMAGALISIIPILIVYIFAQKYFKEGLKAARRAPQFSKR